MTSVRNQKRAWRRLGHTILKVSRRIFISKPIRTLPIMTRIINQEETKSIIYFWASWRWVDQVRRSCQGTGTCSQIWLRWNSWRKNRKRKLSTIHRLWETNWMSHIVNRTYVPSAPSWAGQAAFPTCSITFVSHQLWRWARSTTPSSQSTRGHRWTELASSRGSLSAQLWTQMPDQAEGAPTYTAQAASTTTKWTTSKLTAQ